MGDIDFNFTVEQKEKYNIILEETKKQYPHLFKDEIDIHILHQFLDVLKKIEDGHLDQHEGSFQVGTLLKKLYVDSALKKAEKLEEENKAKNGEILEPVKPSVQINWRQFKRMKN